VRVRHFADDHPAAWALLFDLYPETRMRTRVLAEMRYLMLVGTGPTDAQLDALTDPALIAAFAVEGRITEARFARWWPLAEAAARRPAAINLQERLLFWAAVAPHLATCPPRFRPRRAPPAPSGASCGRRP